MINKKAITTVEISGSCIETIPAGTEFTILAKAEGYNYHTCEGLSVSSVWDWEFKFIEDSENE